MSRKLRRLIVLIHAVVLMVFCFLLLTVQFTYDNESQVISWVSVLKNVLLGFETKPGRERFLLVNTSYQKQLIPRYDEYGFEIGNEAITDRESLAAFFHRASGAGHRAIFCDVFLDSPTDADSALSAALAGVPNVLFPYHRVGDTFVKPVVPVASALSDYHSDFGRFTKYTYQQYDTAASVALALHRMLDGHSYRSHTFFALDNGVPVLNSLMLDFPIRQYDIFREDTLGYPSIHLENLLSVPPEMFESFLRNRIVIVGDFLENDFHETLYGATAGPLIHLNAYLSLEKHTGKISAWFMLYLFVCNLILSAVLFSPEWKTRIGWLERLEDSKMGWILDYLKYAFFLLLMSILSYLLFGFYLNILLISLYFSIVENVKEYFGFNKQIA